MPAGQIVRAKIDYNAWQCIRAPPRRGRYWEIHPRRPISRDPRDFPRAKPEGNLEGRGKSERFSEAVGFAPRDPRDFPRAKPEGNPEGRGVQNPWPREILRAEGMDFPIPPESWWSTDILSSLKGKVLIGFHHFMMLVFFFNLYF